MCFCIWKIVSLQSAAGSSPTSPMPAFARVQKLIFRSVAPCTSRVCSQSAARWFNLWPVYPSLDHLRWCYGCFWRPLLVLVHAWRLCHVEPSICIDGMITKWHKSSRTLCPCHGMLSMDSLSYQTRICSASADQSCWFWVLSQETNEC